MPIKRSVSERRAARSARKSAPLPDPSNAGAIPPEQIPHQAITDSPFPGITQDLASGGETIVRGNSNLQSMNAKGHQTVKRVGAELAKLGGPDEIDPSAAMRTTQTAQDVAGQTGAPVAAPNANLESHAMGQLEGESKTPEVRKFLADLMRKAPNMKIPGQGAMSNRPSESFNDFRVRALSAVRGLMQKLASAPNQRILVPTSTQVIRLVDAWTAEGEPDSMQVSPDAYLKDHPGNPGDIERFFPDQNGKWELTPFKPKTANDMPPGIYFMRHGETDSVQAEHVSSGQKSRAQIISHVRAGNWKGARDAARVASSAGHLSDDEISDAIDEGLPSADDAQRLAPHQLLSAVSAAGPSKRAELMPVLQQKMGNMEGVSPEGQHALRSHLGRL